MTKDLITVTSPLLPDLEEFNTMLKEIWRSKWVTNNGQFHKQLEKELDTALYPVFADITHSHLHQASSHLVK